ncbi:homocysteine S-methyltransferase family protein [Striga asiatica]|uniref:Homocysteine S-methyltransferase family protein n=1 Tax=Striga asiatica TaxID=4170 RepID=A0A5A7PBE8_STRAF|nr:homocysteine S-methyltransferase family protein [Striga asiatica]
MDFKNVEDEEKCVLGTAQQKFEVALELREKDEGCLDNSGTSVFLRADKIDFKTWDVQMEKHLGRAWSKDNEARSKPEEWEIELAKLEIKNVIAYGTYGTVYRGVYDGLDVAATASETAALRASFKQEVVVWHKLDHPNVTKVLDGKPYNRKCDVYSFGICLWEIYCCDMPYPDLSFAEVSSAVVRQCWGPKPETRPEMDEVVKLLEAVNTNNGGGMIPGHRDWEEEEEENRDFALLLRKMGHVATAMSDFLRQCGGGVAVIDGGLATELERHGADLHDPLWSAKCLLTSPHLIRAVHLDYLEAGADIIITASYQATIQGFKNKGYSLEESENLLRKSVEIALEAREVYYSRCREALTDQAPDNDKILNQRPILVAASVGSYGAYLADGSEYRRRVKVLADAGPDLIAFETVPNKLEAQAFAELLEENEIKIPSWLSFNSKDGVNVVSGDSLLECAAIAESSSKIVAVGINCTPPRFIMDLILSIKKQNTGVSDKDFVSYVNRWCEAGASLVGGCCRTTPHTIRSIYQTLLSRR